MKTSDLETQSIIRAAGSSLPVFIQYYPRFRVPRGGVDAPHRHDFQEILWFLGGRGCHRIDDEAIDIEPGTVAVIARGQVHWVEYADDLEFYRLCFHDDFVQEAGGQDRLKLGLFSPTRGGSPLRPADPDRALGLSLFADLAEEFGRVAVHHDVQVLQALVIALLRLLERIDRESSHDGRPATRFVETFLHLLDRHVGERHDVGFYAAELGVTPDRLSQDVQQVLGKTTKQAIRERILLEARRRLIYTDLTIKEVGEAVGFADPQYFGKVFKDALGITPAAYRRAAFADLSESPDGGR